MICKANAFIYHAGFSGVMGALAKIGFFNTEALSTLNNGEKPTYRKALLQLLRLNDNNLDGLAMNEKEIKERITTLGICQGEIAVRTAKTIM